MPRPPTDGRDAEPQPRADAGAEALGSGDAGRRSGRQGPARSPVTAGLPPGHPYGSPPPVLLPADFVPAPSDGARYRAREVRIGDRIRCHIDRAEG
ncbi:hypothetical protein C1708_31190 [Streptomyces sp. DH-12]|nr:hypothetical protein C1708_31190 [Streptomyces sp. DH-12]